ncbi:hypothetical protein CSOJ01_15860, partial [Colletotrichum sojae]
TLPASLKRFHIWDSSLGDLQDDLRWLAEERKSGAMPLLEKIGVDRIDGNQLRRVKCLRKGGVSFRKAASRSSPEAFL